MQSQSRARLLTQPEEGRVNAAREVQVSGKRNRAGLLCIQFVGFER